MARTSDAWSSPIRSIKPHQRAWLTPEGVLELIQQGQLRKKQREFDAIFGDYLDRVQDTMTLATEPWIKLLCVMTGEQ